MNIQIQPDPKKSQVSCRISNPDPVHAHLCCAVCTSLFVQRKP